MVMAGYGLGMNCKWGANK